MLKVKIAQTEDIPFLKTACHLLDCEMTSLYEKSVKIKAELPIWNDNSFEKYLTDLNKKGTILIAEDNGRQTGIALIDFMSSSRAQLGYLVVLQDFRGNGIGTFLIEETKKYVRSLGFKILSLSVLKNNSNAKRLYEKENFFDVKTIMQCKL